MAFIGLWPTFDNNDCIHIGDVFSYIPSISTATYLLHLVVSFISTLYSGTLGNSYFGNSFNGASYIADNSLAIP